MIAHRLAGNGQDADNSDGSGTGIAEKSDHQVKKRGSFEFESQDVHE